MAIPFSLDVHFSYHSHSIMDIDKIIWFDNSAKHPQEKDSETCPLSLSE